MADSDQSMEDILQSIKRIIADEGEAAPASASGSDVLELTDLLAEDAAPPVVAPPPLPAPTAQDDIDALFNSPLPEPEPVIAPPPPPAAVFEAAPVVEAPVAPAPAVTVDTEQLISDATFSASAAALLALTHKPAPVTHASPTFRSGATVEDLVLESLRPMLKDWLDTNLPGLVRSLVEREVRRLSGSI